jgi:hypothetical protein
MYSRRRSFTDRNGSDGAFGIGGNIKDRGEIVYYIYIGK